MDMIQIATHLIDEDKDQPRYQFDEDALQELMMSIGELGLLSPIKVRPTQDGRYQIIYGNRRYLACNRLGLPTIPCIVSNLTDETEIYLEQIAENLTRQGFSPIEEADAFYKLINNPKFNSSIKFVSNKLGKPESYIKNKLELLKFSKAVQKLIISGTEIKKDRLIEDQLIPLKDLAMEHRDAIALIVARDEMFVSDVKKIASLFKDKDISDNTKGKLLYKSGPELLDTWSTFRQNRAERDKAKAAQAAKAEAMASQAEIQAMAEASMAAKPGTSPSSTSTVLTITPIEDKLQRLLANLPTYTPLSPDVLNSFDSILPGDIEHFAGDLDTAIRVLEKHLSEWQKIRELVSSTQSSL